MGEAAPSQIKEHILCLLPFPERSEILDPIRKRHPNVEFNYKHIKYIKGIAQDCNISDEEWAPVTILVTLTYLPSDPTKAPHLKLVHLFSAGTDRLTSTPIWKETKIPITNSSGVHGPTISEWVILQILNQAHRNKLMVEWQRKHEWGTHQELGPVRDGVGQRLGVWGYGAIGRQTARVAKAMGLDVIAYTAGARTTPESRRDHGYIVPGTGDVDGSIPSKWYSGTSKESLHAFLAADIDILLIAVPLTPSTHHALDAEAFSILGKKNAYIVNIARGSIIVTQDLIEALKKKSNEGGLRGAALDVTDPEPLPEVSELWDLENVSITPHVSGLGTLYAERSFAILEENLTRFEQGRGLINVVDREKGY